ncbi:uncharacterized protein TNCT_410532 [Trichonephila clavata]|uniref:Uncharacterized protein n=1 Tax=Trichonephila clavata TaxID=2740835 RepID=A0A8X6FA04_TRICU|nr:uncharacterized protein TNCT_410532 [Trichonephila clavata]
MHWEINVVTSVTLLAVLQGHEVIGVSQESSYVIECIRDIIPTQIYNDCCIRENNCTISRQQNRAIDCMSRIIMTNYSSLFSDSRENGPGTTDMNFSFSRNNQFYNDILDTLSEACRRQPRARLQNCIRNELIKYPFCSQRCRYSMLQDRFTSSPGHWNQRRTDSDSGYDGYGRMEPRRRGQYFGGGRRHHDGFLMIGRPTDYTSDSRYYSSRGGYSDDMDDEEFGYSDSDSMRFK